MCSRSTVHKGNSVHSIRAGLSRTRTLALGTFRPESRRRPALPLPPLHFPYYYSIPGSLLLLHCFDCFLPGHAVAIRCCQEVFSLNEPQIANETSRRGLAVLVMRAQAKLVVICLLMQAWRVLMHCFSSLNPAS
jgi:hypothetical protein